LPEPICRFYFKQMLSALHYIHSKGLAHRDIKLENVLVDRDFNLKVADFGMVAPLAGRKGSGSLSTNCGTEMYKAPEILEEQNYTGQVIDLFASAVSLFAFRAGTFPFGLAESND
jgi:serine/threonine protein kinase